MLDCVLRLTAAEYLDLERAAAVRRHFVDGKMVVRPECSVRHALIASNVARALSGVRECLTFGSDLRVAVSLEDLIVYPAASVVCGAPQFADQERDTVTNPAVLARVVWPEARDFVLGLEAGRYRAMPSLREFLIIEEDAVFVEHFRRLPDGSWNILAYRDAGAVISLASIGCELPLERIYAGADRL